LERALLRAANVDVTRSASSLTTQVDTTLASLSSSLEDMFGSAGSSAATATVAKAATGNQSGLLDTSLGDASMALVNGTSSSTSQTSFSSALASAQSPLDVDDIMDQVVQGLSVKNFTDNPTVNITLNPPNLGQLNVKISVTDSTVNATVVTQSSDVRSVLLDNRAQLDQVFASAGLKLGSLNVDVSGQGLQQEADRRQAQRESVFAASNTVSGISSDTTSDVSTQTTGPSLLGSVDLSLLNQLV